MNRWSFGLAVCFGAACTPVPHPPAHEGAYAGTRIQGGGAALNTANITDEGLANVMAVESVDGLVTATGSLTARANLRNRAKGLLVFEYWAQFYADDGTLLDDTSVHQRGEITALAQKTFEVTSISNLARKFVFYAGKPQ